jgi:ubiquinone/menaquinone biosynthesis C-methylase UbiE
MLERVLEPEVMDTPEEARDYNDMNHAEVNRAFVADLLTAFEVGGDVLDLGTGTALIPIELCQQHEDCRVMAIDMSINMLELARYNLEVEGLIDRIQLDKVDGKQLPYENGFFDVVISNSIVHHIPEPLSVLSEAARVTKDGGWLFFRDLMRPEDDATVKQLVDTYAADENEHSRQMFDDSLRAALDLDEIRSLVEQLGFSPDSVQATSDRHWTWYMQNAQA